MSASSSSSVLRNVLSRPTNPAILPIPPRTTGFNVPKSLHKTRRYWHPNVTRTDFHLTVPGAFVADRTPLPAGGESSSSASGLGVSTSSSIRGVKLQMRRRKDVEKAGGIEGLLVRINHSQSRRPTLMLMLMLILRSSLDRANTSLHSGNNSAQRCSRNCTGYERPTLPTGQRSIRR